MADAYRRPSQGAISDSQQSSWGLCCVGRFGLALRGSSQTRNMPHTSVPLAVAAIRILGGEMRERGVFWPDTAFEPLPFFDEVARLFPEPPPDGKLIGESFKWLE